MVLSSASQSSPALLEMVEPTIDLSRLFCEEEPPAVVDSDLSSEEDNSSVALSIGSDDFEIEEKAPKQADSNSLRRPNLQWEFKGLTIWLELEEFGDDITRVINELASFHGVLAIPKSHTTAIYGMEHLSVDEAKSRLRSFAKKQRSWPTFRPPTGVVQDIAVAGRPGQVCSIAWAQLTLASSPEHEIAMDALYGTFYGEGSSEQSRRCKPWTPHNSVVYDNPENHVLSLTDALVHMMKYPTVLSKERRVQAISLWDTEGKMEDWKCLDRVKFF